MPYIILFAWVYKLRAIGDIKIITKFKDSPQIPTAAMILRYAAKKRALWCSLAIQMS
jgi:hypothetical protein